MSDPSEFIDALVNKALKTRLLDFVQLVEQAINVIDTRSNRLGKLTINGRLVEIPPVFEAVVIGDLHGDLKTLADILKESDFVARVNRNEPMLLVFLGDYGDRGMYSPEVYYVVLSLKLSFPENVILMRGNHEGPDDLLASPHDLPLQLHRRFGKDWSASYVKLKELFGYLYNAVAVKDKCVMLHGGVPSHATSIDDLAYAHLKHPAESHLEEILWSDPEEGIKGTYPSPRGAGNLFGEDVTVKFLEMLNAKVLIRGHEPCNAGYKTNHSGRILTLFSRKGEPYCNSLAAYLRFDLAADFKEASELQRFIKQL